MKNIIITLAIVISTISGFTQNDILFSNYMRNELVYNPGAAGSVDRLEGSILARQQWIGIDEAPSVQVLNIFGFYEPLNGGIGLSVINDRLGYESSITIKANYAYKIELNRESYFTAGLGLGIITKSLDGSKLVFEDIGDQYATVNIENELKPDFSFGIEYNFKKLLTLGLSTTHIDQNLDDADIFNVPRHYYFYSKYNYEFSDKVSLEPALIVKSTIYITQFDINATVNYTNRFWFGLSYRLNESAIGLIGVGITENIKFFYTYDFNIGVLKSYTSGSHEIMIGFKLRERNAGNSLI